MCVTIKSESLQYSSTYLKPSSDCSNLSVEEYKSSSKSRRLLYKDFTVSDTNNYAYQFYLRDHRPSKVYGEINVQFIVLL